MEGQLSKVTTSPAIGWWGHSGLRFMFTGSSPLERLVLVGAPVLRVDANWADLLMRREVIQARQVLGRLLGAII